MSFVQVIDYTTSRGAEMEALLDEWRSSTEGQRSTARATTSRDRNNPDHYVTVVEFPSYDDAMRNSGLPATQDFAAKMAALCDAPPTFIDLDVIRTDDA